MLAAAAGARCKDSRQCSVLTAQPTGALFVRYTPFYKKIKYRKGGQDERRGKSHTRALRPATAMQAPDPMMQLLRSMEASHHTRTTWRRQTLFLSFKCLRGSMFTRRPLSCLLARHAQSLHEGPWQWAFAPAQLSIWADCPS